jgi:aconitate hydratase
MNDGGAPPRDVQIVAERENGEQLGFEARVRIDTPREAEYYRHGGILQYVLRALLGPGAAASAASE